MGIDWAIFYRDWGLDQSLPTVSLVNRGETAESLEYRYIG